MIVDLVKFLNVGKTMNAEQVSNTSQILLNDYGYLQVEDFKLFFNNAKKGLYGQTYDRIDGQVIIGWLNNYVNERTNAADEISYNDHLRAKSDVDNSISFTELYFNKSNR